MESSNSRLHLLGVRGAQARQKYIQERTTHAATLLQSLFRGV